MCTSHTALMFDTGYYLLPMDTGFPVQFVLYIIGLAIKKKHTPPRDRGCKLSQTLRITMFTPYAAMLQHMRGLPVCSQSHRAAVKQQTNRCRLY